MLSDVLLSSANLKVALKWQPIAEVFGAAIVCTLSGYHREKKISLRQRNTKLGTCLDQGTLKEAIQI